MKRLSDWQILTRRWQPLVGVGAAFLAMVALYVARLGSIPGGLSVDELHAAQHDRSLHEITNNPLGAPYSLVHYAFLRLWPHSIMATRLTSIVVALSAIVLFFSILYRWHGRRTAWLGTILFAPSAWLLHIGRLGTSASLWLLIPLTLILLGSWLHGTVHHSRALTACAAVLAALLFIPGSVWFVVTWTALLRAKFAEHWQGANLLTRSAAVIITVASIAALAWPMYRQPSLIRAWLGAPAHLPEVSTMVRQWLGTATYLFVRGPYAPQLWLAHVPILDVFTTVVCLLGTYFYGRHFSNLRTRTLIIFAGIGSILIALNGPSAMSLVVPLAYLVAATGVTYLLHEWLSVFPRNPVARTVGVGLIAAAIICTMFYHATAYFVAWRYNPETQSAFGHRLIQ